MKSPTVARLPVSSRPRGTMIMRSRYFQRGAPERTGTLPKYPTINSTFLFSHHPRSRFLLEEAALGSRLIRYSVSPRGASPAGDTRRKVRRAGSSFRNSAPGEASAARIPESDREKKLRTRRVARARARARYHPPGERMVGGSEGGGGASASSSFFLPPFLARARPPPRAGRSPKDDERTLARR